MATLRYMYTDYPEYRITEDGRVYKGSRRVSVHQKPNGYLRFTADGKKMLLHRAVLESHMPVENRSLECCHDKGVRDEIHLKYLRWGTRRQNLSERRYRGESLVPNYIFNKGKHKGMSFKYVLEHDRQYLLWMWAKDIPMALDVLNYIRDNLINRRRNE